MKEYKILTVRLGVSEMPQQPASIPRSIREFFSPTEELAGQITMEPAEQLMQEMNRDGWEVVSAVPYGVNPQETLLITFEREL